MEIPWGILTTGFIGLCVFMIGYVSIRLEEREKRKKREAATRGTPAGDG